MSSTAASSPPNKLTAFVNFPSPYTQSLILQALTSLIPYLSLTTIPPSISDPTPQLQWADYDLLKLDDVLSSPTTLLLSSYVYRKTLIRKHLLQAAIAEYIAKQQTRNRQTVLEKSVPKGTAIDIQFADELDEMLVDELYEVKEALDRNEGLEEAWKRKWFLVKPGLSDKGQGIRMFSTESELRAIMESFDPPSDDEDEYEDSNEEDDEDEYEDSNEEDDEDEEQDEASTEITTTTRTIQKEAPDQTSLLAKIKQLAISDFPDDEDYIEPAHSSVTDEDEDDDQEEGTNVQLSQLRHFVIQEYVERPMLLDPRKIGTGTSDIGGGEVGDGGGLHKFHLRAYVLLTGTYELYLSRTMLALFSDVEYSLPGSKLVKARVEGVDIDEEEAEEVLDLRPHLTNTCLQVEGVDGPPAHLVHLFSELVNSPVSILTGTSSSSTSASDPNTPTPLGTITQEWLEKTYKDVGKVVSEAVQAGVECGGFGMQLLPNAFEIFGVDLMLSLPTTSSTTAGLPEPTISLLEFNASPDFTQSGDRLKTELGEMFKGVVRIVVAPFFGVGVDEDDDDEEVEGKQKGAKGKEEENDKWQVGGDRHGWTKIAEEQTRGAW